MEFRLPIRSRFGNLVLIGIGVVFLLAGIGTFAYALISTWGYAGATDRAMQIVLLGCAAFGGFLITGARRNLGGHPRNAPDNAAHVRA